MFFECLKAELIKSKGTFYLWLALISSALMPFMTFMIYLFRSKYFIPKEGENPWENFFLTSYRASALLLFPFFIVILVSLISQIEHKNKTWEKIFVLPIRKEVFFLSKLVFVVLIIFGSVILFDLNLLGFGTLAGLFKPELKLLEFSVYADFLVLLERSCRLFISVLSLIVIQFSLSFYFKNFIIPVSLGIFLTVAGIILSEGWEYSKYVPYAFGHLHVWEITSKIKLEHYGIFSITEWQSLAYFILISVFAILFFSKKAVR